MKGEAMKKACVLLAEGFEEVEALTPVDYLRRAGIEVTILGLGGRGVRGARGITVVADAVLEDGAAGLYSFDAVIVPGGMPGAKHLADSEEARELIKRHFDEGRLVAAICAAPAVVLQGGCGILNGRRFTGYPGTERQVSGGIHTGGRVVVDGNLITSRGAGTAGEFAIAIIEALAGRNAALSVAESVLLNDSGDRV